jgi:pimeloyl-ACP methyl ester carboxylesterase
MCATLAACQPASPTSEATDALASVSAVPGAERCRALAGTRIGKAIIDDAEMVEQGEPLLGLLRRVFFEVVTLGALEDLNAPTAFCRVTATLRPIPGSEITTEIWLPQQWNGKLLGTGGAGFNGGLIAAARSLGAPLMKGYAAMANDAGHGFRLSAKFAHQSREKYEDFGYRANHVAAEYAKSLIASYYGMPAKRAYFQGCSNGGRDALMLARRFPDDYDGIIAGAPAGGWSKLISANAWNRQVAQGVTELKDKLGLVQDAVIAKCDALDGVQDELLENPSICPFDPAELQCTNGAGPRCLDAHEVAALRKIYGGPRLRDGTKVFAGLPVGGEGLENNWTSWIFDDDGGQELLATESFRWMVYGDSKWEVGHFDIDRDYPQAKTRLDHIMDADDPDLGDFVRRGGKLLLYHGWNDAALPAGATIDYHAALRKALGPVADEQVRLFLVPGMMHCSGGPGATDFDALDHMDHWAESGVAPERIIAKEYEPPAKSGPASGAKVVRTRPLCPWPKVAHYHGSGSTDDADNFSCR